MRRRSRRTVRSLRDSSKLKVALLCGSERAIGTQRLCEWRRAAARRRATATDDVFKRPTEQSALHETKFSSPTQRGAELRKMLRCFRGTRGDQCRKQEKKNENTSAAVDHRRAVRRRRRRPPPAGDIEESGRWRALLTRRSVGRRRHDRLAWRERDVGGGVGANNARGSQNARGSRRQSGNLHDDALICVTRPSFFARSPLRRASLPPKTMARANIPIKKSARIASRRRVKTQRPENGGRAEARLSTRKAPFSIDLHFGRQLADRRGAYKQPNITRPICRRLPKARARLAQL